MNSNGRCSELPKNCESANPQGTCLTCIDGYRLNENQICVRDIPNCLNVNPQTDFCIRCISGYYRNTEGFCSKLPDFCLAANPSGICLLCVSGYDVINGICVL